jgi:hypothetical protein
MSALIGSQSMAVAEAESGCRHIKCFAAGSMGTRSEYGYFLAKSVFIYVILNLNIKLGSGWRLT